MENYLAINDTAPKLDYPPKTYIKLLNFDSKHQFLNSKHQFFNSKG